MIFKPKIKKVLQYLSISAIALTLALTLNTIQTHASDIDQGELNAFLGTTSSADSTSQNQQGGNKTIKYGVHPTKTGYMAYLLTKDGQRASNKAVAFKSPGFSYYPGNVTWKTQSRLGGYSVSSFEGGPAPWNLAPWKDDGKTSNEPNIKDWMLTKEGGVENTLIFIKDHFGHDAAVKYGEKEYILVIETLMHLQFSYPGDSSAGGEEAKEALLTDLRTKSRNLRLAASNIGKGSASNDVRIGLKFLEQYNFSSTASKIKKISDEETQRELISDMLLYIEDKLLDRITEVEGMSASEFASQSSGRIQIEPMLVGTVPNLVKIKSALNPEPTVFDSYLNRTAAVAEYIRPGDAGEAAGFIAWDGIYSAGNNKIKNADVIKYGLGMMVFTAQTDNQTTADESKIPTPHNPPKESEGTYSIVKSYRTKEGTTLKDDGTFSISNIGSDITIEAEGKYQVIGWKVTSTTSTAVDSINWNPPGSTQAEGTTPSSVKITDAVQ